MSAPIGAIEQAAAGGTYVDPRLDRVLLSERATARVTQLSPRAGDHAPHGRGHDGEAIGDRLGVSAEMVRTHLRNVIRKLQARNRIHAIAVALERGEIALDADHV